MNVGELKFKVSEDVKALIPEPKLKLMIQAFKQLDSNQDGKIGLDEFLDFSLAEKKAHLIKVFEAEDTDKDGFIEFEEYVTATEPYFSILKKFRELDLDQNGLLSIEEALDIADRLVLPLSTKQVQTIMHEVDRDGDGQITYYEYLGVITHIGFQ
ncbi:MAG: EF-hand domain-containing protein [Kovacikia sp.]|jgi:calmodulin